MRDKLWVILNPSVPDGDIIAKHFFKTGKKGRQTFKTGKIIIHFHIPNEIYEAMLEKRETDKWQPEKNTERKPAGRKVTARAKDVQVEPSMAADFTVNAVLPNNTLLKWELLGCCNQREETSPKSLAYI